MGVKESLLIKLAKQRTCAENRVAFYLAGLLCDRGTLPLFCLGYAYFRWVDDLIDDPRLPVKARNAFIVRQQMLIDTSYAGNPLLTEQFEEQMIQCLIQLDNRERLRPYIQDMIDALTWDAQRRGKIPDCHTLELYSLSLGRAYTNALQAFVACRHSYPETPNQYAAGVAAHLTHKLRDLPQDWQIGYYNISWEEAEGLGLTLPFVDFESLEFRRWVETTVQRARRLFTAGKRYLDHLHIYRCKLLGHLYCARYEVILDAIEHNDYSIRETVQVPVGLVFVRLVATLLKVTYWHYFAHKQPANQHALPRRRYQCSDSLVADV